MWMWLIVTELPDLVAKTKVIKKEYDALGLLKIDDDLFTCATPLGEILNEFNRLSGMDDDMFTYDVKIHDLSYSPCAEQKMDDFDNGNLNVYERKMCYDECEKMYADAVIFINKRLNYKKQFDEYKEIRKQKELYGLDVSMEYDPSYTIGDDKEVITDDEPSNLRDENLIEENEIAQIFRINTDIFYFETLLCEAFKEFNYLLKIDVDVLTDDIPGFKTC
nr:hypothetical protein [Tanacetum cinerariifolium]